MTYRGRRVDDAYVVAIQETVAEHTYRYAEQQPERHRSSLVGLQENHEEKHGKSILYRNYLFDLCN